MAWRPYVPAAAREEEDPSKQRDTSHRNRFEGNRMGVRPDGTRDLNGNDPSKGDGYADFWWDDEGRRNCWKGNRGPGGRKPTTAPPTANPQPPFRDGFPLDCPVTDFPTPVGDESKTGSQTTCAAWDPQTNPDPIGCDWFRRPPEPR